MDTKKEKLLKKTYDEYINLMLYDFPIEKISEIVANDVTGYGTTVDEKVLEIKKIKKIVTDQREQGVGVEMQFKRIPVHRRMSPDEDIVIYMDEFEITMVIDENRNVIPLRLSSIFEFNNNSWKLVHLHGSKAVETEEDTWHLNEWKQKSEQLQKLVDKKTAELLKQNHELEIEAALERVRSRTIAMHKSSELVDVASVLFHELRKLGGNLWGTGFGFCNENTNEDEFWFANEKGVLPPVSIPHTKDPTHKKMYQGWKNKLNFFSESKEGKELLKHYDYMLSLPKVNPFFQNILDAGLSLPQWQQWNAAYFSHGYLLIITLKEYQQKEILKRFAKIFDQTYTRFLDLQKAEKQAREAQIELALERVRSRTMAMQHSDELQEASFLLDQQVRALGIKTWGCAFNIYGDKDSTEWFGNEAGVLPTYTVPRKGVFKEYFQKGKKGESLFIKEFLGDECVAHYEYMSSLPVIGDVLKNLKKTNNGFPTYQIDHVVYFKYGYLLFITREHVPDAYDIFKRFSKVFEQTYTRFLDLQKAEEQAREVEIELALERVRAKTMAMQHSDELQEVIKSVYDRLVELEIEIHACTIITRSKNPKELLLWFASSAQQYFRPFHIPNNDNLIIKDIWRGLNSTREIFSKIYPFKEKNEFFNYLFKHTDFKHISKSRKQLVLEAKSYSVSNTFMKHAGIQLQRYSDKRFSNQENEILIRFGKVFEQTYIRFLDLKKAEAQAKEAQIEIGLERVRAEMMAMHKSDELRQVVGSVFTQLQILGFEAPACSMIIYNEDLSAEHWFAGMGQDTYPKSYKIPFVNNLYFTDLIDTWKKGTSFHAFSMEGKLKIAYAEWLLEHSEFKYLPKEFQKEMLTPDLMILSDAFNRYGMLEIIGPESLSESKVSILQRFSKVFEQTYTRFLDLQKAEEQAREAQIETSLERLRSSTMAMHKSKDLLATANLLYKEFRTLGITQYFTCGFVIVDEENSVQNVWVTDMDGEIFESFNLPLTGDSVLQLRYEKWQQKVPVFYQKVGGAKLKKHLAFVIPHFGSDEAEDMVANQFPDPTYFYMANFSYGYLHIVGDSKLTENEEELLARFMRVFEQTYTRFLDLQKAEAQAREAQIEAALERVRSRSMAMYKSDELLDVGAILYREIIKLGISNLTSGFVLVDEDAKIDWNYLSNPVDGSILQNPAGIPNQKTEVMKSIATSWKKQDPYLIIQLDEEATIKHQTFIAEQSINFDITPEQLISLSPKKLALQSFNFKQGYLLIVGADPLPTHQLDMMLRFTKVFEMTYRRFLDLQKAEAQAREAEIELALERVRARTMAMQHSKELQDAALILFNQVEALGVPSFACGFNIWAEDKKTATAWMARKDHFQPPFQTITDEDVYLPIYKAQQKGESLFVLELRGEDLVAHYKYLTTIPEVKAIEEELLSSGLSFPKYQIIHCAYFSMGYLMFISYEPVPGAHDIFKRFAKVFEQTYTRFLDLKKAEAQARESQIEAALEKIRSRSLAMHKPDELQEVVAVVAEKLQELGVIFDAGGVILCTYFPDNKDVVQWIAVDDFSTSGRYFLPYFDNPIFNDAWDSKIKGDAYFSKEFPVEAKNEFFKHAFENSDYKQMSKDYKQHVLDADKHHLSAAWSKNSAIIIPSLTGAVPSESDAEIMKRFARVFEQAYIRFLDLQKAEAQAREAQIEAALERVRSKAMAMHKSDELLEVITVISAQLQQLNIKFDNVSFGIHDAKFNVNFWLASSKSDKPQKLFVPYFNNPIHNNIIKAKQKGLKFFVDTITKEENHEMVQYLIDNNKINDKIKIALLNLPGFERSTAILKNIHIYILRYAGIPFTDEENKIFIRFTNAFEQAYIRFLDLQKAEAQAREAQIETALEKVRSRTMAMQQSNELPEAANNLFLQVQTLGIPAWSAGYCIWEDESKKSAWCNMSSEGEIQKGFSLPTIGEGYDFNKPLKKKQDFYVFKLGDKALVKHYDFMKKLPIVGEILKEFSQKGIALPTFQIFHIVYFTHGYLMFITYEAVPNEWGIFKRFGKVFEQTYTRFLDLQKAEALAIKAEEDLIKLQKAKHSAEVALSELKETQSQLIQSEKMASLGELTAGIAHEIQNPLNFVNNFSEVSKELLDEMKTELDQGNSEDAKDIADDVIQNLEKINHHGKRAGDIVKGMLQHSRTSSGVKEPTNINVLANEYLRLAYHGLRAKDKSFNSKMVTDFDASIGKINIIPQDIGRVILNLITNAFYAVSEKKTLLQAQGDNSYEPTVSVSTKKEENKVLILVKDNGNGIPQKVLDKIFQPFFTTKPAGQGTGLGLSLSYDIIKAHGGDLKVETKEGESLPARQTGTVFIISLSLNSSIS